MYNKDSLHSTEYYPESPHQLQI